ncbi:MAG: hypothetical protein QM784_27420 [Polyangiaceae bacterium]
MNAQRSLLVVGKLRPERKRSLTGMAAAAHFSLVHLEEPAAALEWLDTGDPGCLLLDGQLTRLDKIIAKVRSKSQLCTVPILALVSAPDELWIEQYFGWGGDDIVDQDAGASLLERLKAASREQPKSVLGRRAILADSDPSLGHHVVSRVRSRGVRGEGSFRAQVARDRASKLGAVGRRCERVARRGSFARCTIARQSKPNWMGHLGGPS